MRKRKRISKYAYIPLFELRKMGVVSTYGKSPDHCPECSASIYLKVKPPKTKDAMPTPLGLVCRSCGWKIKGKGESIGPFGIMPEGIRNLPNDHPLKRKIYGDRDEAEAQIAAGMEEKILERVTAGLDALPGFVLPEGHEEPVIKSEVCRSIVHLPYGELWLTAQIYEANEDAIAFLRNRINDDTSSSDERREWWAGCEPMIISIRRRYQLDEGLGEENRDIHWSNALSKWWQPEYIWEVLEAWGREIFDAIEKEIGYRSDKKRIEFEFAYVNLYGLDDKLGVEILEKFWDEQGIDVHLHFHPKPDLQ